MECEYCRSKATKSRWRHEPDGKGSRCRILALCDNCAERTDTHYDTVGFDCTRDSDPCR